MNHYILIRRLRGPAILLLFGILALLHSTGVLHSFWHLFWPLLFILLGVLLLAERAALASENNYPPPYQGQPYAGPQYPGAADPGSAAGVPSHPTQAVDGHAGTDIVRAPSRDMSHYFGNDPNGGQS